MRHTADRRKVLVEVTDRSRRIAARLYAPIASEGASFVGKYTVAQLKFLRDYLVADRDLQERHRQRIKAESLQLE